MKKKIFMMGAVILGLMSSIGLTGCGSSATKNEELSVTTTAAAEKEAETTKLVFLRAGMDAEAKSYWQKTIEGFEQENPNIKVEYQESPYGDDFETKLNTGFASGTAPDIINFTMASMGTRVPLGQYAPLNEYVDNWEGKEDFMENALGLGTINGNVYGIPIFADPRVLIYNKELFEAAGLDPENPPSNWDELVELHEKLIKKDGDNIVQTGMGMPTTGGNLQQWFSIFAEENGIKNLVDEDDDTVLINTPEAIEAAEFMQKIKEMGTIPWDSGNRDQNPFGTGLAAMTFGNDRDFQAFNTGALEGKIAMAVPMKKERQATFCGMGFMFMNGETTHKDEVWKFIEYVSRADNMWTRYQELGTVPLRESLKEQFIAQNPDNNAVIFESINYGSGSPKVPYANSVYNIVNEAMEKIMYGVDTPENALNVGAQKIQEEIDNK